MASAAANAAGAAAAAPSVFQALGKAAGERLQWLIQNVEYQAASVLFDAYIVQLSKMVDTIGLPFTCNLEELFRALFRSSHRLRHRLFSSLSCPLVVLLTLSVGVLVLLTFFILYKLLCCCCCCGTYASRGWSSFPESPLSRAALVLHSEALHARRTCLFVCLPVCLHACLAARDGDGRDKPFRLDKYRWNHELYTLPDHGNGACPVQVRALH